jgi:hypothetical protein
MFGIFQATDMQRDESPGLKPSALLARWCVASQPGQDGLALRL